MENQPTVEELLSKIELCKQALKFYSNTENYNPLHSKVMSDGGHQARFTLEQLEKIDEYNQKLLNEIKEVDKLFKDVYGGEDESVVDKLSEINNLMKKYKNDKTD